MKLAKSDYSVKTLQEPVIPFNNIVAGYQSSSERSLSYHKVIEKCRNFYEIDNIAGTVINRMTDISLTPLRNKHRTNSKDEIKNYYDGIARILTPLLAKIPLAYLIDGMAICDYKLDRLMGNRIHQDLGRTRYYYPKSVWVRDAANIILKKSPTADRLVYMKIPEEDLRLIEEEGKPDRVQEYQDLLRLYPDYVASVKSGKKMFLLDVVPIFRKMTSYNTYPLPYLKTALEALDYRRALLRMDKVTADRVIDALRQISVGNDEFPADDEDIIAAKSVIQSQTGNDTLFNVYTNHTIKIQWIIPPIDGLLNNDKYIQANANVFLSLGFPRIWVTGENERSNASDNSIASIGPLSMIGQMRNDILLWIRSLYEILAEKNDFLYYPEPYFSPINLLSAKELLQYGLSYIQGGIISKNTGALLFGNEYNQELEQIEYERSVNPDLSNTAGDTDTVTRETPDNDQTNVETPSNDNGL